MAQVYLARETGPNGRRVALKQILPHLVEDTAFVTMFLDEARIAARLHHPNVVEIYDLGKEGDAFFIAMEFIFGEDLRRIEKRAAELSRPIPVPLACRIVREAARGLDYAHRRTDAQGKSLSIVHRDVSPQNILVGFDGSVKMADFGVAKAADKATITASGVIKGKHPYMSPEQALGQEDLDCRTDVFALGVVLYEAVTGVRLFRRATDLQTLQAVAECTVVPPSKQAPGISLQLDDVLMTALTRERERRYPSCAELGAALDAYLATQPDSSAVGVARYLAELFADRLQREARSGPKPTFGVSAAEPLPPLHLSPPPGFDKAKTIELATAGPIPGFDPASTRPTDEARARLVSATVETKAERPSEKLAALVGNETLPARPPMRFDGETLPPGESGIGITQPQQPGPFGNPTEPQRPGPFGGSVTVPFGKAAAPTGTAAYGRPAVQTVTSIVSPHDEPTLNAPPRPPGEAFTVKVPVRRSSAPVFIALATLVPLAGAGWYVYTLLNAPALPVAPPPAVAPVAAVVPDAGAAAPKVQPLGVATGCDTVLPLTVTDGRLFLKDAAQLKPGTGFRLVGDGVGTRDYFGMAMVVEVKDGAARLIADEPQRLPDKVYACPAEEELPLKGSLHSRAGSTSLGFENTTDFDWTECEVFLPNNTQARLPPKTVVKPGKVMWINGVHATPRRVGAEPKLRNNTARIRCDEGDGELSVIEEN